MSVLTSEFLILCDLPFLGAAVNKLEPLNSCTIWGTFHSLVVGLCRGSEKIRQKKTGGHFNLRNISIHKPSYYENIGHV